MPGKSEASFHDLVCIHAHAQNLQAIHKWDECMHSRCAYTMCTHTCLAYANAWYVCTHVFVFCMNLYVCVGINIPQGKFSGYCDLRCSGIHSRQRCGTIILLNGNRAEFQGHRISPTPFQFRQKRLSISWITNSRRTKMELNTCLYPFCIAFRSLDTLGKPRDCEIVICFWLNVYFC